MVLYYDKEHLKRIFSCVGGDFYSKELLCLHGRRFDGVKDLYFVTNSLRTCLVLLTFKLIKK